MVFTSVWGLGGVFEFELLENRPGILIFRVSGKESVDSFKNESGGHRFQRFSPTDKRGRIHSSTITVAVMPELTDVDVQLSDRDLDWTYTKGSGSGGQKRNKTSSAVQLTHIPSGIQIRCEAGRSQSQNRETALTNLRMQLWTAQKEQSVQKQAADRKHQVGAGQRGDKRRTIRTQDDSVTDHVTGKYWSWDRYRRGIWD